MFSRAILIAAIIAAASSFTTQARAGADGYGFEPVKPEDARKDLWPEHLRPNTSLEPA